MANASFAEFMQRFTIGVGPILRCGPSCGPIPGCKAGGDVGKSDGSQRPGRDGGHAAVECLFDLLARVVGQGRAFCCLSNWIDARANRFLWSVSMCQSVPVGAG